MLQAAKENVNDSKLETNNEQTENNTFSNTSTIKILYGTQEPADKESNNLNSKSDISIKQEAQDPSDSFQNPPLPNSMYDNQESNARSSSAEPKKKKYLKVDYK